MNYLVSFVNYSQTYFLREIAFKKESDCSEFPIATNVDFVGITFNGSTPISEDGAYLMYVEQDQHAKIVVLARIYFALFTKDITWAEFVLELGKHLKILDFVSFLEEILLLIRENYLKKQRYLVLLFDEIKDIEKVTVNWNQPISITATDVRQTVCVMCDNRDFFHQCIFSVLDFTPLYPEVYSTKSNRPVVRIGTLSLLSKQSVRSLWTPVFDKLRFSKQGDAVVVDDSSTKAVVFDHLFNLSLGHPRTVDYIFDRLSKLRNDIYNLEQIISYVLDRSNSSRPLPTPSWEAVQAVLIPELYNPNDPNQCLPGSNVLYSSAIAEGWIVASTSHRDKNLYPQVPELFLHKWVSENISVNPKTTREHVAFHLNFILRSRSGFTATSLEEILLKRRIILSHINSLPHRKAEFQSIPLSKLFQHAIKGAEPPKAFSINVDASRPMEFYRCNYAELPKNASKCLALLPTNSTTKGFDAIIRLPIANSENNYVDLLFQYKYSAERSKGSTNKNIFEQYEYLDTFAKTMENSGYLIVYDVWRQGGHSPAFAKNLEERPNAIVLNKEKLQEEIGPFYTNFLNSCEERFYYDIDETSEV